MNRYVEESADQGEVELIETRLLARADQQRSTPTRASLGRLAADPRRRPEHPRRPPLAYRDIRSAFGDMAIAKIDSLIVERCYAELRHCRRLCK
jgi:hypothetical protein